ncbi:MAG: type II toxin-antitoxin system RelE/ParE family toxin [bacterium]
MVDKIQKVLDKLVVKEKNKIKQIILDLKNNRLNGYDIKKLKGRDDIYRIRKGKMRIIYRMDKNEEIYLLTVERRSDTIYNL